MLLFIAAVAVVLVVSFLCSIFESVLLSLTRPQIAVMRQKGSRAGAMLEGFKENMDVPIAAILILNTAAHTVGAAVAGASYSEVFDPSTLWIFSLVFTLAVLLFTEIIPKTLGVTFAGALAVPVAHGINWLSRLLKPLVIVSEKLSRAIRGKRELPVTSPEEIRVLAALGRNEGVVGVKTATMIVGATHLADLHADDVMLPGAEVAYLHPGLSREAVVGLIQDTGHSRFPFTPTGDLNDVSGMVLAKHLFHWLLTNPDAPIEWEAIVQEPLIVPSTVTLPRLLRTFQESHRHLALVVDEYGGVLGIATLEDVLEEIVGEIHDESDKPVKDLRRDKDGTWLVRGRVDLRRLSGALGIFWQSDAEVSTVGGLMLHELERIPKVGDAIEWKGYRIEVVRADHKRARLLAVRKL